ARFWARGGPRDDPRGRGRAAIDQYDQRLAVDEVARHGVEALNLIGLAAPDRDDFAAVEKRAGHPHRLIQQAARIVAQIDNVALDLLPRNLRPQRLDRGFELVGHPAVELGDPDVSDVAAFVTF